MDYLITDLKEYIGTALLGAKAYKAVTCLVILLALISVIFSRGKLPDKIMMFLLTIYMYFVFSTTVIIRPVTEGSHLQLIPFWSYISFNEMKFDIAENILLFVPPGIAAGMLKKEKYGFIPVCLYFCFFSICIELMQYFLKVGLCEFDDVFHNTAGSALGYGIVYLVNKNIRKKNIDDEK